MADSKIVKAVIADTVMLSIIPMSCNAKYVKKIINRSGKFLIVSTITASNLETTGIFAYLNVPINPPIRKLKMIEKRLL